MHRRHIEAGPALSGTNYDVFISHAGQQKASFAVWIQRELRHLGVSAFLDERSLRLGDAADTEMEAATRTCHVVVAVLTPDFVRSSYCMEEQLWALDTQPHLPLCAKDSQPAQRGAAGRGS